MLGSVDHDEACCWSYLRDFCVGKGCRCLCHVDASDRVGHLRSDILHAQRRIDRDMELLAKLTAQLAEAEDGKREE